jgi:hypothetical protein
MEFSHFIISKAIQAVGITSELDIYDDDIKSFQLGTGGSHL